MLLSRFERFSNDQAITASAAATDSWDGLAAGGGIDNNQRCAFVVTEDFNALTSLTVKVVTDDALPIDGSSIVLAEKTVLLADLVAGARVFAPYVPRDQKRYVSAYYTVTGTDPTTGKFKTFLTDNLQDDVPAE